MSSDLRQVVSKEEQGAGLRVYSPKIGWFSNSWGVLDLKDWGILSLYGIFSAVAIPIAVWMDCKSRMSEPAPQRLERKAEFRELRKAEIVFQSLEKRGEEYIGRINGKSYMYRFDLEKNKVGVYLAEEK